MLSGSASSEILDSLALSSGRAHLAGPEGGQPEEPGRWGWREEEANGLRQASWSAQGRRLGWVDGGGEGLYLDPEAAYAEAQKIGDEHGERLPLTQNQLYRRLKEARRLAGYEKDKTTKRVTLQGEVRAVLHLPLDALSAHKQGEQGEQGE